MLEVRDLAVAYGGPDRSVEALRGVSFTLQPGAVCGILGASGCGKTTLALALAGLLPGASLVQGEIQFEGRRLTTSGDFERVRGTGICYVPQEPALALNPVLRAVTQVRDAALCALRLDARSATAAARSALAEAGLDGRLQDAYPHELSGGQRQRILLARAMLLRPRLLIADEPTSALDAITQREILALLTAMAHRGTAILFITHNPFLLIDFATWFLFVEDGRIAQRGGAAELSGHPWLTTGAAS